MRPKGAVASCLVFEPIERHSKTTCPRKKRGRGMRRSPQVERSLISFACTESKDIMKSVADAVAGFCFHSRDIARGRDKALHDK